MFTRILILVLLCLIYHRLGYISDELEARPTQHATDARSMT